MLKKFDLEEPVAWATIAQPPARRMYQHQDTFKRRCLRRAKWAGWVDRYPGGCWLWTGPFKEKEGRPLPYPIYHLTIGSHRVATRSAYWWMMEEWFPEFVPSGKRAVTVPSCGQGLCVSPIHRTQIWSTVRTKLTPTEVLFIYDHRHRIDSYQLADMFGVSQSAVANIWTGKRWSNLTGKKYQPGRRRRLSQ